MRYSPPKIRPILLVSSKPSSEDLSAISRLRALAEELERRVSSLEDAALRPLTPEKSQSERIRLESSLPNAPSSGRGARKA